MFEIQHHILPVESPPITSYANHAFYLSMLSGSKQYLGWFYCNYIQIKSLPYKKGNIWFDFYTLDPAYHYNPHLTTTSQILQRDMLSVLQIDILDFIRESIDTGYYVHLNIDESVIPESPGYKKGPFFHPIFIYGYNNVERKFKVGGFFNQRKYQFIETDYKLIKQGYDKAIADQNNLWINRLQLYKINPSANFLFDIECVLEGLTEYYFSVPSDRKVKHFENPDTTAVFGLRTYDSLKEYIGTIALKDLFIDIRPFHVIWEHKKVMISRLEYMSNMEPNLNLYIEAYDKLGTDALIMRNMALKFNITEDTRLLEQLLVNLNNIQLKEKELLEIMLPEIEKCI